MTTSTSRLGQRGLARLPLPGPERGEAEVLVECGGEIHRDGHPSAGPGRSAARLCTDVTAVRRRRNGNAAQARAGPASSSSANLPFASSVRSSGYSPEKQASQCVAALAADRLVDALEREVGERVALQVLGDLLDRAPVGDHLLRRRHVDAVVAGVADRRRGDAHVHLGRAGVAQHLHDLARGVAAHDRVVDDDQALALDDLAQRVELHPQAVLAQLLAGLDERARDVAVLDQAVVARQARRLRVAGGGGVARVGHRDHHVGVDRRLAPEDLAHLAARDLGAVALEDRVRAGEVDVLEDAERLARRVDDLARLDPALGDRDHLAGLDLAQQLGADDVERAALGGDAVAVADPAERQRPQPGAVAEGDDASPGS